ncbi:putative ABC transporter permease [Syntrophomonas wolfei]|jgi:uncharacterized membrane protein|uniref:putative ABC transporter permease n=1 Tax=Syntrophomonas wolfei TaxID=863 RepID=UPI000314E06F|nr:membrane protein [Syntrophomonas wolfei]
MLKRFLLYGILGWTTEILFTGMGSLLNASWRLGAHTYLWMFPIYGLAVFLEPFHDRIRSAPWPVRGFIWASLIIGIEYLCGWLLKIFLGFCPWDYSGASLFSLDGFVRLDYTPFWFIAGLAFEQIHDYLDRIGIS